ncbi:hypothetical protein CBR_g8759 [Chara braunii]|uniref:Uncharacterized protein n=1 Tax=Chara braunii TaxID=69332 RepID=A0A388KMW2_CHABU|nr:hypothetical protein CBR_g8759 [Chara braunii]|eukprot:GBG71338.1 hypothetical protein CBR_g8759 [Chara braunii]
MQTDSLTPIQALENVLIHDNRQGFREKAQSRGNPVNEMRPDDDEDDFAVPNALPKLMPSDDIPDSIAQDSEQPYFIPDKVPETTSDKWGHHILWHMDLFEPCIVQGKWMMAVHLTKGWKVRDRLDEASWLKLAKSEIVFRVRKENDEADEAAIEEKARLLFERLYSKNRLEYKHGFYDLESSRSYKSINWKIDLPQAGHGVETIWLGCSQIGGESNTQFATSVGEAMSQTASKIMEANEDPRNVDKVASKRTSSNNAGRKRVCIADDEPHSFREEQDRLQSARLTRSKAMVKNPGSVKRVPPVKTPLSKRVKKTRTPRKCTSMKSAAALTPATKGTLHRLRFRNVVMEELKDCDATELQRLCKEEGVLYDGKVGAIFAIADSRTRQKYGLDNVEMKEIIDVGDSETRQVQEDEQKN